MHPSLTILSNSVTMRIGGFAATARRDAALSACYAPRAPGDGHVRRRSWGPRPPPATCAPSCTPRAAPAAAAPAAAPLPLLPPQASLIHVSTEHVCTAVCTGHKPLCALSTDMRTEQGAWTCKGRLPPISGWQAGVTDKPAAPAQPAAQQATGTAAAATAQQAMTWRQRFQMGAAKRPSWRASRHSRRSWPLQGGRDLRVCLSSAPCSLWRPCPTSLAGDKPGSGVKDSGPCTATIPAHPLSACRLPREDYGNALHHTLALTLGSEL